MAAPAADEPAQEMAAPEPDPEQKNAALKKARNKEEKLRQLTHLLNNAVTRVGAGPFQLNVLALGGGVYAAEGSLLLMLSIIAKGLVIRWGLSPMMAGVMAACIFLGLIIGTAAGGFFCDRFGRRKPILVTYLGIVVFIYIGIMLPSILLMLFAQFMLGFFLGFGVPAANALVAESCPPGQRSNIYCMTMVLFSLGQLYSATIVWVMSPEIEHSEMPWRYMLAVSALLSVVLLLGAAFFLYESPHWLLVNWKVDKAKDVILAMLWYKRWDLGHRTAKDIEDWVNEQFAECWQGSDDSDDDADTNHGTDSVASSRQPSPKPQDQEPPGAASSLLGSAGAAGTAATSGGPDTHDATEAADATSASHMKAAENTRRLSEVRFRSVDDTGGSIADKDPDAAADPEVGDARQPSKEDLGKRRVSVSARTQMAKKSCCECVTIDFWRVEALFSPHFRCTTLIMTLVCASSNFAYYGMIYGLPDSLKNAHKEHEMRNKFDDEGRSWTPAAGLFFSALSEIPGVFVAIVLGATIGRRRNMTFTFFCCFMSLCVTIWAMQIGQLTHNLGIASVLCMKLFLAAAYIVVYLYLLECYPTTFRATGLAFCMVVGRTGAFSVPFLYDGFAMVGVDDVWFFVIMAGSMFIASILCCMLPFETKDAELEGEAPAPGSEHVRPQDPKDAAPAVEGDVEQNAGLKRRSQSFIEPKSKEQTSEDMDSRRKTL